MWIYALPSILTVAILALPFLDCRSVEYVLEGKDITLKCRVPRPLTPGAILYWMGPINNTQDNYAIDDVTFNKDYKVDLQRSEGRYDLTITRATYDRNNGLFSCRAKEKVTGFDLHSTSLNLTVLIKPGSPRISPPHPSVTQGHPIRLTCSSQGGSPDPEIFWYRKSNDERLQSVLKPGGGRDFPTTSVLTIEPRREDDGAEFLCEVRNRALSPREKMVSSVRLNVNYYPIVRIVPANPVRVIEGEAVTLTCDVDAKPPVLNVRWMRGGQFIQTTSKLSLNSVTLNDAGRYICQADNSLNRPGEAEVSLEVLYPPEVRVPVSREVPHGEEVRIACNVTANPTPDIIYWTKKGDDSFRQKREFLRLSNVKASDHGDYVCHAISVLTPSGAPKISLEGNGTVSIRVRHAPGKSFIIPTQPVAVEDRETVLTCRADPPGFPEPKYRWWMDGAILTLGANYTIPQTLTHHEGQYHCQPFNEDGNGTIASATLRVFQAPKVTEGLKPTAVYLRERTDLRLSCRAQGKPEPVAKWFKDGQEIAEDDELYDIQINSKEMDPETGFVVQSTLAFRGPKRIGVSVLRPEDRGSYECTFENEAERVVSKQLLRIQHPPSLAHKRSKVAFDVGEDAKLSCRMRAYPSPSFAWMHDNNLLSSHGSERYVINDTDSGDDQYDSVLTVRHVKETDYGAYTCKATNDEGSSKTLIFLQKKGLPSPPEDLEVTDAGTTYVEIGFDPGFDGGYPLDTNYSAKVSAPSLGEEKMVVCNSDTLNKCLLDNLRQNTEYRTVLFATNPRGESQMSSPPLTIQTTLDPAAIPAPNRVLAETSSGTIVFGVPEEGGLPGPRLEGRIEVRHDSHSEWRPVPDGVDVRDGRGSYEIGGIPDGTEIRVKLCSRGSAVLCGPFLEAKQVSQLPQNLVSKTSTVNSVVIIVVVVVVVVVAMATLGLVCCCCRQQRSSKLKKKAAQMEVAHRGIDTQQAPPPPYYTVGMENKGMDGSIDRLSDNPKAIMYNPQQPYQNYSQNQPIHGQQNPNAMGVGFMDNSYSNSNNGGSVNSQDSLWQVKSQQQHAQQQQQNPHQQNPHQQNPQQQNPQQQNPQQQTQQHPDPSQVQGHHPQMDPNGDPRSYQYNPMVHGGYGITGYDDYAHYPPMSQPQNDYSRNSNNYNANHDPYGVHKPVNSMDTVDDSYDASGMAGSYYDPHHNPNLQGVPQMTPQDKPHISFDESLESGFSTPNSRNRRIIREIIV